jgi:hypothetical protein
MKSIIGTVSNDPPPAMTLSHPATTPTIARIKICQNSKSATYPENLSNNAIAGVFINWCPLMVRSMQNDENSTLLIIV